MLYTIALILLIMWLLSLASGYAMSLSMHGLVLIAIGLCFTGFILGRRQPVLQ